MGIRDSLSWRRNSGYKITCGMLSRATKYIDEWRRFIMDTEDEAYKRIFSQ